MILSFLFFAFVAYLVYKLVFGFVIPLYKTTRQVKQKFREMNERMRTGQGATATETEPTGKQGKKSPLGEYIDFEEVKD